MGEQKDRDVRPTDEQLQAIAHARDLLSMKVMAFAGSGKTTVLKMIADELSPRRGLYLAFNRAIANEAALRMPDKVTSCTFHTLAARETGRPFFRAGRIAKRLNGSIVAQHLDLNQVAVHAAGGKKMLSQAAVGLLLLRSVERYCKSTEKELGMVHMCPPDIIGLSKQEAKSIAAQYVSTARRLWRDMSDPDGSFPSTHDVYVKLWTLQEPVITGFEFILFDEAQDADPVMLEVVQRQTIPVFWVGDSNQQIYQWRGAVNAMQTIETKIETPLTMSFRFGQEIASQANRLLGFLGETRRIIGNPSMQSRVQPFSRPAAILCRTNAEVVRQLMMNLESGRRIVATGVDEAKAFFRAAINLQSGRRATGALALFDSWSQVVEYSKTPEVVQRSLGRRL